MIPLFLCMLDRNFVLAAIFALSLFLSSSTNGIIFTAVLFAGFFFAGNFKVYQKVFVAILSIVLGFALLNSDLFSLGVDKIERTNFETNQRIMNGPNLVSVTPSEYLLWGADAPNINDFLKQHNEISTSNLIFLANGNLFVSDFWRVWVKYGIIGLILVLLMYFKAFRLSKGIRPYLYVLCVALFSQSVVFGSAWALVNLST